MIYLLLFYLPCIYASTYCSDTSPCADSNQQCTLLYESNSTYDNMQTVCQDSSSCASSYSQDGNIFQIECNTTQSCENDIDCEQIGLEYYCGEVKCDKNEYFICLKRDICSQSTFQVYNESDDTTECQIDCSNTCNNGFCENGYQCGAYLGFDLENGYNRTNIQCIGISECDSCYNNSRNQTVSTHCNQNQMCYSDTYCQNVNNQFICVGFDIKGDSHVSIQGICLPQDYCNVNEATFETLSFDIYCHQYVTCRNDQDCFDQYYQEDQCCGSYNITEYSSAYSQYVDTTYQACIDRSWDQKKVDIDMGSLSFFCTSFSFTLLVEGIYILASIFV